MSCLTDVAVSQTVQYTYDSLNRLTSAQYPDRLVRYTYDAAGNRLTLSIERMNPAPTLTAVSPASALAGSPTVSVTLTGTGFVDTSVVTLNGASRPTTFVSAQQLTALVSATDLATTGTASLTISNPAPGGGVAPPLSFSIVSTCSYALTPTTQSIVAAGGSGSTAMTSPAGCLWDAVVDQPWISLSSASTGVGPVTLSFTVAANASSVARVGHLTVAGAVLTINQAGAACTIGVAAAPSSFAGVGGSGVATITASPADCTWTALSSVPWITVTGTASGVGNGIVAFDVAANPTTASRAGDIAVGGQAASIVQDGRLVVLTVNKLGSGAGTLVSAPSGVACGPTCTASFAAGQQVTLTATTDVGSSFDQWSGDPDCADGVVTLNADMQCDATFLADTIGNPVPVISSVSPLSVAPGVPGVTLAIEGANFHAASVIRWNGVDHVPTSASTTHVETTIPAARIVGGTSAVVSVWTPGPGGGASNEILVHVTSPSPSVELAAAAFNTGAGPVDVTSADLNGDGNPDVVSANVQGSSVSVALGTGAGTFGPVSDIATGAAPSAIRVADLNRDGHADLVTTNYTASSLSVHLGNGDGTFGLPAQFATGIGPFAAAIADLDANGSLDVVVANEGASSVSVLRGNGDGTFRAPAHVVVPGAPRGVLLADVNADGALDLVASLGSNVAVLAGAGDGSFGTATTFAAGNGARGLAAGDFNGDRRIDVLVANELDGTVSVLLGDGTGGFGPALHLTVAGAPRGVAVGDVDADGRLDVVATDGGTDSIAVIRGNGDGTFVARRDYGGVPGPVAVTTADLDRDGRLDLAVAGQTVDAVTALLGRLPAAVTVSPSAIDFGARGVGAPSATRTISVTNSGGSPLDVSAVAIASGAVSEFQVVGDSCSAAPVAPGSGCAIVVRYLAIAAGVALADLRIDSNAPGSPQSVTLRGEGVAPSMLDAFVPLSGPPGTIVTLTGTSLTGASAVAFNSLTATTFVVNSATSITVEVPVGATSGPISVTTPLNVAVSPTAFQVPPRIDDVSTSAAPVGAVVTITGGNFLATGNVVRFGPGYIRGVASPDGLTLQFTVPDSLDLCVPGASGPCIAATPPVRPGSYPVQVLSGSATSNVVPFVVTP